MTDETTLRRLAYVKSVYDLASIQLKPYSDIEISRSLISLDSAVEAFIWIVLGEKIPDKVNSLHSKSFGDLLTEFSKHAENFDINTIRELHTVRNNIQHNSLLIAESQARRYYPVTEKMFQNISKSTFDIEWNMISLSMLIEDIQVKERLQAAEKYFASQDYRNAAKYVVMAFEIAKTFRQFGQMGSGISVSRNSAQTILNSTGGSEILQYTQKIEQELEVLKLGLDYSQWLAYRRELGNVNPIDSLYSNVDMDLDEKSISLFLQNDAKIEEWVRKNLPFARNTILRWQDSMINIGSFFKEFSEALDGFVSLLTESDDKS